MIKNTTDNHLGLINNLIYQNTKSSKILNLHNYIVHYIYFYLFMQVLHF